MIDCICTSIMFMLGNGNRSNDFKVHRGLRQGDPLFPFLFLIVVEGLSALVSKAVENETFNSCSVNDNLRFPIMQFADDTMLMGKDSWDTMWSIKTILRSFELVSGLNVNFHKSKLIGINLSAEFLETTSNFFHCRT